VKGNGAVNYRRSKKYLGCGLEDWEECMFVFHLIYKHERLSTPAPGPLVVVKAVFLAGEM